MQGKILGGNELAYIKSCDPEIGWCLLGTFHWRIGVVWGSFWSRLSLGLFAGCQGYLDWAEEVVDNIPGPDAAMLQAFNDALADLLGSKVGFDQLLESVNFLSHRLPRSMRCKSIKRCCYIPV